MSIRKTILFSFSVILILLAILLAVLLGLKSTQNQVISSQDLRQDSLAAAAELRQSSDDLTRLARLYVVNKKSEPTQAEEYLREYNAILDIRNGKVPRPEDYRHVFWDFAAVEGKNPTPNSNVTKSLNDIMKDLQFTDSEFALLQQANTNSDGLVAMEVAAMNLVDGKIGDIEKNLMKQDETPNEAAIRILHSKEYMTTKANIMKPVNDFLIQLEKRTAGTVQDFQDKLQLYTIIGISVITLLIVVCVIVLFITVKVVMGNLNILKVKLAALAEKGGDLSVNITVDSQNEVGDLSRVISKFLLELKGIISQIIHGTRVLTVNIDTCNSLTASIDKSIEGVVHSTHSLTSKMEESNQHASRVNENISEISEGSIIIAEKAIEGSEASAEITTRSEQIINMVTSSKVTATEMFKTSNEATLKAIEDSKSVHEINSLSEAILKIANQTNLLALNARIESARAGENGKGFTVVADEIRTLAEESNRTAKRIREINSEVVSAVDNISNSAKGLLQFIGEKVFEDYDSMLNVATVYGEDAKKINDIALSLSAISEEQHASLQEIKRSVEVISSISSTSLSDIHTVGDMVLDISNQSNGLKHSMGDILKSNKELSSTTEKFQS